MGDLNYTLIPLAGFLGALGGWCCKWFRRYLLPITGAVYAYLYGVKWWRCVLYAIATAVAFSLGYSPERNSMIQIFLVGASYGATPLILRAKWSWGFWPLMSGVALAGLMQLSLAYNWFTWKLVEIAVFSLHGYFVARAIEKER